MKLRKQEVIVYINQVTIKREISVLKMFIGAVMVCGQTDILYRWWELTRKFQKYIQHQGQEDFWQAALALGL